MAKKLITDEEMDELREKGCIGLCPTCGMPVYKNKEHNEEIPTYIIGSGHELFDEGRNFFRRG